MVDTFPHLASLATSHFKQVYQNPPNATLAEVIIVVQLFPRFTDMEEAEHHNREVTMGELEATLKWFKRDKSPGPDGCSIEFYLAFFEVIRNDLLKVIEKCRKSGRMHGAINTTFIALIPKSDNPSSYNDFRPISLCNCLYKIISKIIANHICPILSAHISSKQFAFLKDRQIHEAIRSA